MFFFVFFFQAEDGIRDFCLSRGLGDVYKRQVILTPFLCLFSSCRGVARCRYDDTIGSLIEKKLREQGRTVTWFATALHCDRTNVYKIFQKSSIDSSMLYRISCILGYDFFSEYTQSFDKGVAKKSTKS